jgi:hypothetical protein
LAGPFVFSGWAGDRSQWRGAPLFLINRVRIKGFDQPIITKTLCQAGLIWLLYRLRKYGGFTMRYESRKLLHTNCTIQYLICTCRKLVAARACQANLSGSELLRFAVAFQDWFGVGSHAFAAFCIFGGYSALRKLRELGGVVRSLSGTDDCTAAPPADSIPTINGLLNIY